MCPFVGTSTAQIVLTNIAEPKRVLPVISAKEVAEADRLVKVELDEGGVLRPQSVKRPGKDEYLTATVVESSYGTRELVFLQPVEQKGVDDVRVRIDRFHLSDEETTLTYRDAKIVQLNGRNFLSLPENQVIGTILGHEISLRNKVPTYEKRPTKNNIANQEIRLAWDNDARLFKVPPGTPSPGSSRLKLLGVTPPVESMGLDTLHVLLRNTPEAWVGIDGFKDEAKAKTHPTGTIPTTIPELKLHIGIRRSTRISSQLLLAPVRRVVRKRPLLPGLRQIGRGRFGQVAAP
jgi:hypothetical protein